MSTPQEQFEKLKKALNAANSPHFNLEQQEQAQLQLRPDPDVSPAQFIKDTLISNTYRAHPITIRAVKKDIFVAGNGLFEDLEILYKCDKCEKELDLQFWHFCPYCEAPFPKDAFDRSNVNHC